MMCLAFRTRRRWWLKALQGPRSTSPIWWEQRMELFWYQPTTGKSLSTLPTGSCLASSPWDILASPQIIQVWCFTERPSLVQRRWSSWLYPAASEQTGTNAKCTASSSIVSWATAVPGQQHSGIHPRRCCLSQNPVKFGCFEAWFSKFVEDG